MLVATPVLRYPPRGGPEHRTWYSLKALSLLDDVAVSIAVHGNQGVTPETSAAVSSLFRDRLLGLQVCSGVSRSGVGGRFLSIIFRLVCRVPFSRLFLMAFRMRGIQKKQAIQVAWVFFGNISLLFLLFFRIFCRRVKLISDTDSVWSRFLFRTASFAPLQARPGLALRASVKTLEERLNLSLADITTAVSETDAVQYRALGPSHSSKIFIAPNVVASVRPQVTGLRDSKSPRKLLITGTFDFRNSPMAHGTAWFLNKVWPLISVDFPALQLLIAGRGAPETFGHVAISGVSVEGTADDFSLFFEESFALVVPIWFESGTRIKILEAGRYSLPVVSTSLGAEGLELREGREILLGDRPDIFADQVRRLLVEKGLDSMLGNNLRQVVAARYSVQALAARSRKILEVLDSS